MSPDHAIPPLRAAIIAQVLGSLIALGLVALIYPKLFDMPLAVAGIQGLCAAFSSYKLEAPPWWLPIHIGFMSLVVAASNLGLRPGWYLAAFVLMLLIFWRTDRSRVPLYLSNARTASAVAALLPKEPCQMIDLGCGNGSLLKLIAGLRPDCQFVGIEHAPIPWLWARLNCADLVNCRIRYGNFWKASLADYALTYVFLSPAPMAELWRKAKVEMPAGALLISNSFAFPDVSPQATVSVDDSRGTLLYCYRPGG